MRPFIVFRHVEISTKTNKNISREYFDWMIVKLRMHAT